MSTTTRFSCSSVIMALFLCSAVAHAAVINFENLPDSNFFNGGGQNIGSFYAGVTFGPNVTGLSVSRFGGYANSGFPPHSGDVAVWDAADPTITISFASEIQSFGIWYTSFDPLTLQAYDATNTLLGTVVGNPNTDGTTGTSAFLSISSPLIRSATLSGSAGLFTLDDVTTVPEPCTFALLMTGILILLIRDLVCRRRNRSPATASLATPVRSAFIPFCLPLLLVLYILALSRPANAQADWGPCVPIAGSLQSTVYGGQSVQGYVRWFYKYAGPCSAPPGAIVNLSAIMYSSPGYPLGTPFPPPALVTVPSQVSFPTGG